MQNPGTEKSIVIGKILTTHGVHGQMKVQSMTHHPSDLGKITPFMIEGQTFLQWTTFKSMGKPGIFLARLPEINTLEQAALLRHAPITIARSQLPPVDGEIYYSDLENKAVMDCHGTNMGTVLHVHDFGAGPVLELSPSGIMISFYDITDPDAETLTLKLSQEIFC